MALQPANLKDRFIQAGLESVKGTETSSYTDILANVGASMASQSEVVTRNTIDGEFGASGGVHTSKTFDSSISFENKGGGSASPQPEISPILQACALSYEAAEVWPITGASGTFTLGETVTSDDTTPATGRVIAQTTTHLYMDTVTNTVGVAAGLTGGTSGETATMNGAAVVSAVYLPVSDYSAMKTISLRDVRANDERVGLFTMGTGVFNFATSGIPGFDATLTSLYQSPIAPVSVSGVVSTVEPQPWIGATFEINGATCGEFSISSFSLSLNNTVARVQGACAADGVVAIMVTDAAPSVSVTITKPTLATFNPWALRDDGTKFLLYTSHGTATGERIRIGIPRGQIMQITEGEENGVENYTLTIDCTKSGGANVPKFHAIYW